MRRIPGLGYAKGAGALLCLLLAGSPAGAQSAASISRQSRFPADAQARLARASTFSADALQALVRRSAFSSTEAQALSRRADFDADQEKRLQATLSPVEARLLDARSGFSPEAERRVYAASRAEEKAVASQTEATPAEQKRIERLSAGRAFYDRLRRASVAASPESFRQLSVFSQAERGTIRKLSEE